MWHLSQIFVGRAHWEVLEMCRGKIDDLLLQLRERH